jgi:glutamate racemase
LNFPYGTKSDEQVKKCATSVALKFYQQAKLDILVIACNTASTIALDEIRASMSIPVVGVVPAIKPAAEASRSKKIGILATPATIQRPYLDQLIDQFASDCHVVRVGSSSCVAWAEAKLRGEPVNLVLLEQELKKINEAAAQGMDQLVLGCTHFPLISDEISNVLPKSVRLVDSGSAIAQRVTALLSEKYNWISPTAWGNLKVDITGFCSGETFQVNLKSLSMNSLGTLELLTLA